jgi:hypothetical protein
VHHLILPHLDGRARPAFLPGAPSPHAACGIMIAVSSSATAADLSEVVVDLSVTASPDLSDEVIRFARAAAVEVSGGAGAVGDYLGAVAEDDVAVSVAFAAIDRGYRGWYWSVTLAIVEPSVPTISEVVLLPGEQALLAPPWVPWEQRIRAGDVGAGDLLATPADDPRLVPGYLDSDDPAIAEVAYEFGFGRVRVLGREGREEAAQRWHDGSFGPDDAVARQAPATCVSCGFFVPLAGLLGMAMGACANEFSPADGRVVDVEFGCGAHSETVIEAPMMSASTDTVVDELTLEVHPRPLAAPADQDVVDRDVVDRDVVDRDVVDRDVVDQDVVDQDVADRDVLDQDVVDQDVVDQSAGIPADPATAASDDPDVAP